MFIGQVMRIVIFGLVVFTMCLAARVTQTSEQQTMPADSVGQVAELPAKEEIGISTESSENIESKHEPNVTVESGRSPTEETKAVKTVGKIVNFLNKRLLSQFGELGNLFFSPFSISVALAMTYLGARGKTAVEMEKTLGYRRYLGNQTEDVHELFGGKLYDLEHTSGEYKLQVANGIFVQNDFKLREQFLDDLEELYGAKAENVDFAGNGKGVIEQINQWSYNQTVGKIPTLLSQPLDPLTKMALLNAIYFKGLWKYPFNVRDTRHSYFYKINGTKKMAQFMVQKRRYSFYADSALKYKFLSLPYKGSHMSMWFILPFERTFPSIELTNQLLSHVRQNLRRRSVYVEIPKFQMSYERDLTNDMTILGLTDLFSTNANLSGMSESNDLYASKMVHKAVIDVGEQGTEAAAVTGMFFVSRSGHSEFQVFTANHPFLFCILDKRSNTILFMGRVCDP